MSQYKTGTATVTNGSATVTGTNTLWLANVTAGDSFTIASTGVMYNVASVDSDTQVTLSAPYAGVTASGVVYAIGTGFTVPDSFPEMSQGDIETATIFTRGMRKIQSKFTGIAINTTAEIGQAVSDKADQATTYTETEVDELTGSLAYPNTTLASSSDISESLKSPITAYPHIQGFRTGTGTALTFAQAVEEAAERGARLLTIQELEAGVAFATGYSYGSEITWTSSPAGVGLVYGNLGDGDGTRVVLNTNTDTAAGGYAVSVVGQRQWTDTQYADQATTYTETEVDSLLDDKADKATTYTETEVDGLLNTKADQATTYTETEVDELTGSFAYPNTTLASSSDISESVEPAIAAYPHIQGFRTGTGTALTFAQAVEEAAERGARLLTIQELEAGVAFATGYSYGSEITWTSSPAGVGLVYGNLGDGDGTRVVLNTNTDTAAGGYAVSVVGQRQWTDTQYADQATTYTETEVDSLLDDKAAIAGQVFTGDIAAPKITASTGILFGTDTAAANTLDDYEEGTWTVILSDENSGGNVSGGTEVGYYTKIGRIVHLNFSFKDIETGGMTEGNILNVQNVPFTAISNVNLQSIPGSVYFNEVTLSGNAGGPVFDLSDSLTTGKFRFPISAATAGTIKVSDIDSGRSGIRCAITYTTD